MNPLLSFYVKVKRVIEFDHTYRTSQFFCLREGHPPSEFGLVRLLFDMIRSSFSSADEIRVK